MKQERTIGDIWAVAAAVAIYTSGADYPIWAKIAAFILLTAWALSELLRGRKN